MKFILKSMKWLLLLSGMLIVILGISMLFVPLTSLAMLAVLIGIGMFISGISEIATFLNDTKERRSYLMLTSGILSALFGVWAVFGSGVEVLSTALPYVFAVWIMSSGITRIISAISLKSEAFSLWRWLLAFGILGTALGFLLLFSPVLSGMLISISLGILLISHGTCNIILFYRINKVSRYIKGRFNEEGGSIQ